MSDERWPACSRFLVAQPSVAYATKGCPLIVCVARLEKVKNLGLLLEACATLRERGVAFRCALVGDGRVRQDVEATRARLGLENIVEMTGAVDHAEVLKWWQRAAVATLTSDSEGLPVSLLEAAACGVPAVATAVGGIPELVEDGVTGLLASPGNARSVATAWQRLREDDALRARLGAAARRRVEERFGLARQVDALLAVWDQVTRHD